MKLIEFLKYLKIKKKLKNELIDEKIIDTYALRQSNGLRLDFLISKIEEFRNKNDLSSLNILEIGAWSGFSTLRFAQISKSKIITIDPWDYYTEVNDINTYTTGSPRYKMQNALKKNNIFKFFLQNISNSQNISFLRCNSEEAFKMLQQNYFDIIYIDGDHSYKAIYKDIQESLKLIKRPGLICGDDLEKQYHELDDKFKNIDYENIDYSKPYGGAHFHIGVTFAVYNLLGKVNEKHGAWFYEC